MIKVLKLFNQYYMKRVEHNQLLLFEAPKCHNMSTMKIRILDKISQNRTRKHEMLSVNLLQLVNESMSAKA